MHITHEQPAYFPGRVTLESVHEDLATVWQPFALELHCHGRRQRQGRRTAAGNSCRIEREKRQRRSLGIREGRVWVWNVWETVCWGSPSVGERVRIRYMKLSAPLGYSDNMMELRDHDSLLFWHLCFTTRKLARHKKPRKCRTGPNRPKRPGPVVLARSHARPVLTGPAQSTASG